MHLEIMKALVEIVKSGGGYALWGLGVYLVINLCKVTFILVCAYQVIRLITNAICNCETLRFVSNKDNITLMSEEVSTSMISYVKEYQEKTEKAMRLLMKDVKNLLKESKEQEKK